MDHHPIPQFKSKAKRQSRMSGAGVPRKTKFEQQVINAMVEALIERRGYFAVIDDLIAEVHSLGEISLADPSCGVKLRDFDIWAQAVRTAILKHDHESTFENRVTEYDRFLAAQMCIRLTDALGCVTHAYAEGADNP